jgi:hypothetical protein
MFIQIEAMVVKNAKRQDFVDGVVTINTIKYLLTTKHQRRRRWCVSPFSIL